MLHFWLKRPTRCREPSCDAAPYWVAIYSDDDEHFAAALDGRSQDPPSFSVMAACDDHKKAAWDPGADTLYSPDPHLVVVTRMGEAQHCTLRSHAGADQCGNPETHIALYVVGPPEMVRVGPACGECLAGGPYDLADGEVYAALGQGLREA